MRLNVFGGVIAVLAFAALIVAYSALFTVYQTQQALVVRLGQPVRVVERAGPARQGAVHRQRDRYRQAHPRSGSAGAGSDRLRPEAAGGRRLRALPHPGSAALLPDAGLDPAAPIRSSPSCSIRRCAGCSARRPSSSVVRDQRAELMARIRELVDHEATALRHPGGGRAHPARRPAGAEQPGGLSAHADRSASARRPSTARKAPQQAQEIRSQGRPRGDRAGGRRDLQVRADPRRGRRHAQPDLRRRLQQGPGLLRLLPLDAGLRGRPQGTRHAVPAQAGHQLLPLLQQSVRQAAPQAAPAAPAAPAR